MKHLKTFESFDEILKKMKPKTPEEIKELKDKLSKKIGSGDSEAEELTDDKYKSKVDSEEDYKDFEINEFGEIVKKSK